MQLFSVATFDVNMVYYNIWDRFLWEVLDLRNHSLKFEGTLKIFYPYWQPVWTVPLRQNLPQNTFTALFKLKN